MSSSSQAGLLAEIDRLGTNILIVGAGRSFTGEEAKLPREAPVRMTHLDNAQLVADTALIKEVQVYRNSVIPVGNTGGLEVRATSQPSTNEMTDVRLARPVWRWRSRSSKPPKPGGVR